MKRIDKLTDEQIALMPAWVEKWTAIGLSTEPADWRAFEIAVRDCYRLCKLEQPRIVIGVSSPLVTMIVASILSRAGVDAGVADGVGARVDAGVRAGVGAGVDDAWNNAIGGNMWCSWPAYTSFMRDALSLNLGNHLNKCEMAYRGALTHASWWTPYLTFVVASDRPAEIHRDTRGRSHNETGMAVRYRDGWGVWMLNGITVSEQIVMRPETLTVEQIRAERQADVRAIMQRRYGYGRYLREVNARVLDVQVDAFARPMALMAEEASDLRVLVCTDGSTGRVHHCPVPREIDNCLSAETWLAGYDFRRVIAAS